MLGAVVALRQNYRQRLRQFEEMYVQRYWTIIDRFPLDAVSKDRHDAQPGESDQKAIRAYIRLCEDELEMRAEGWIGDSTYKIWASSICMQLRLPMFARVWQDVRKESTFPYAHMGQLLSSCDAELYDPCQMRLWRRWFRGLAGIHGV